MNETKHRLHSGSRIGGFLAQETYHDDSMYQILERDRTRLMMSESHKKVDNITLIDSFGQIDNIIPQFNRNYLYVQNCMPSDQIFSFKKMIIFSDIAFVLSYGGKWTTHYRQTTTIRFGRIPIREKNVRDIVLNSENCSRNHFEINFNILFEPNRIPSGLYFLIASYPSLKSPRILKSIIPFFEKKPLEHLGNIRELGSLYGTWIGIKGKVIILRIGESFFLQNMFFIEVVSIFHREGNCIYCETNKTQLERQELNFNNFSSMLSDFYGHIKHNKEIYFNNSTIQPPDFSTFLHNFMTQEIKFSMITLKVYYSDKSITHTYSFIVSKCEMHDFTFGHITIKFSTKIFQLFLNICTEEEFPAIWQAVSPYEKGRFTKNEIPFSNNTYLMIENSIIKINGRQF